MLELELGDEFGDSVALVKATGSTLLIKVHRFLLGTAGISGEVMDVEVSSLARSEREECRSKVDVEGADGDDMRPSKPRNRLGDGD